MLLVLSHFDSIEFRYLISYRPLVANVPIKDRLGAFITILSIFKLAPNIIFPADLYIPIRLYASEVNTGYPY